MCGSQTDQNIAQILLLLGDRLMFYQPLDVNLSFNRCMFITGGASTSIRTDLVAMLYGDK